MPGQEFRIGKYFLRRRHGTGSYYVGYYDPASEQTSGPSLRTDDPELAKARLAEWVVRHGNAPTTGPRQVLVPDVFARYYAQHGHGLRSGDVTGRALRLWLEHFGAATVAELTPRAQERFLASLRDRGYSDGYCKRTIAAGAAAIRWTWKRGELTAVPPFISVPDSLPRQRVLELEEIRAFWKAIEEEYLAVFFILALNTAARPSALLELTRFQLDLKAGLIDLNPPGRRRTKKGRPVVKITRCLRPWLDRAAGAHVVHYRGRPLKSIKAAWRRTRAAAGLGPDVIPYSLRHTCATFLDEANVPENEIAAFLGHAREARTTGHWYIKRRTHRPGYLANVVAALDGWMAELALETRPAWAATQAGHPEETSACKERASA